MTHRDPGKVVPSYASLVLSITPPAEAERDLAAFGREVCDHLRIGMEHAMEQSANDSERTASSTCTTGNWWATPRVPSGGSTRGWTSTCLPAWSKSILEWQEANRMGASGTHRYTPEQFGLTAKQIRSDYDFYIERFDVAVEGDST